MSVIDVLLDVAGITIIAAIIGLFVVAFVGLVRRRHDPESAAERSLAPYRLPGRPEELPASWETNEPEPSPELAAIRAFPDRHIVRFGFASFEVVRHPDGEDEAECKITELGDTMKTETGQMQVQGLYVQTENGEAFTRFP